MKVFIEQQIIDVVRCLLIGRVNELLGEVEFSVPLVEFGNYSGNTVIQPTILLSGCERSEKERLLLIDSYTLTITFSVTDCDDSRLLCYVYAAAVDKAIGEDVTLGGIAERAVLSGKKYADHQKKILGENTDVILTYRITVTGK